ncbi:MAG: helix-turn-helix transcriptional regulator [Betaproteobacteria bacterium]|nr:MAG: helix-turn-helix transcriptional regulator [Betaproteobacteria bacterium]
MGRMVRLFEGRFGRLVLAELAPQDRIEAHADPAIVLPHGDAEVLFLNPGEVHVNASLAKVRALAFHPALDWLRGGFPAAFGAASGAFPVPREPIAPRIRRLADTLEVEVLNDRFLSPERLEFMLQELVLSIVETYLAKRRASSPLWRGSRFEDSRIRRAIALLRARPNKDLSMDEVATEVGLSRSRFYDLFQLCTGFSPRAYLDMLCVETAIARLSSGQGKIGEVSAELGFSAQSNFTRFFLNQVGVPPSEYRRASTRAEEPDSPEGSASG